MDDQAIYDLYWARNEQAIAATHQKYGPWCRTIAHRILMIQEETEECVSDTYMTAWNKIPPERPNIFKAWLGKITRNLALSRYRKLNAEKRGGGQTELALEELEFCVSGKETIDSEMDSRAIVSAINRFLTDQSQTNRDIFMRRYFHMESIREIAGAYRMSESRVTSLLFRQRKQLKSVLEQEGIEL